MDSTDRKETLIERAEERNRAFVKYSHSCCHDLRIRHPRDILNYHLRGHFPVEKSDGFYNQIPQFREIIPITTRLPHGIKQAICKNRFTFTINRDFERVVDLCAVPRLETDHIWIRGRMKTFLRTLHTAGYAHSIEGYSGDELAGGVLGLQIGALFVTLSLFGRQGAGYAVCGVLQHVLSKNGFLQHDAISPSPISEFLHGELRLVRSMYDERTAAAEKKVQFEAVSSKMPVAEYIGLTQTRRDPHGRPFPR